MPEVKITERDFLAQVIDLAHVYHWRVAHFRPSRTKYGWTTAVQADGAGFPDLVLVRPPRCLFVEVKTETGQPSDKQYEWLRELSGCPGISVCIWRPHQFEEIAQILSQDILPS